MSMARTVELPHADELKLLWKVALAVFVVTVVIGLVNGQRIAAIDPRAERPVMLTHLHTGTIGWITLGLFSAVIWVFTAGREGDASGSIRSLTRYVAAAIGIYPLTFFLFYPGGPFGSGALLGIFGTLALIAIVWMLVWTIRQSGRVYMSPARLAALTAVINLTLGAVLGVLAEARFAGFRFPGNVNEAHPAMMTVGYILPAAFAFVEWRVGGGIEGRRSLAASISIVLLLVGGWLAAAAATLNLPQLFPPILLLQVVATVLLAIRMAKRVVGAPWLAPTGHRHVAMTAIAIVLDVALLLYTVMAYFARNLEPPRALFVAIAHVEFVGVMTNALFATILMAAPGRREHVWPWADHVIFWGTNVGWAGFAVIELLGALGLARLFTPIMGISLLLGIATYWMRLGGQTPTPAATSRSGATA
jgi:hypothetical protein